MTTGDEQPGVQLEAATWEHFPHDADIGVRGFGDTREAAFEAAAMAMAAIVVDPRTVRPQTRIEVSCTAPDDELLLVDWLNALIYEMATRHMVFGRFRVDIADGRLTGEAWGEPIDATRHRLGTEVKGATYTALQVARTPEGKWVAQCVVDV
ncbi:MAG: archease [Alphaproteobacteria bacterium]|nr:MAG: archease [Alphaproteobacteria bacterium]